MGGSSSQRFLRWGLVLILACCEAPCWVPGQQGDRGLHFSANRISHIQRGDGLPDDAGRRDVVAEWLQSALQAAGTALVATGAFCSGAKLAVINQPQQPELRGPFRAVGSRVLRLAGLRCRVLYPAQSNGKEAPYLSEGRRTSDAMARLVFFPGFLLEHLGTASSGCWEDAPPSASPQGLYPVFVYSHGQGGNMDMGTFFLRQIASYGLIVLSVEHQDGSASTGDESNPRPFSFTRAQLGVSYRAQELIEVTKALLANGLLDELGGDGQNILVGGHSYGGPTAILAANAAPELFSGLVLHDPAVSAEMPQLTQPVFSIVGDEYAGILNLVNMVRKVSSSGKARPWSGLWHFNGISHGNFVDAPLWAPLPIMRLLRLLLIPAAGPADPAEAHNAMASAAADFAKSNEKSVSDTDRAWQLL